jgi:hypothetical protein
MKIISATTETPGMTKEQVDMFLEGKLMLQLSTLDEKGEPNIQPVWFYHEPTRQLLSWLRLIPLLQKLVLLNIIFSSFLWYLYL